MKTILSILASFTTLFTFAQEPVTWLGGTPGQATSWHVATNWSNHQVPDENTIVIINNSNTGHHAQPVISQPVEVRSIEIYNGASLQVTQQGGILIDGTFDYTEGIQVYGGHLINNGFVVLHNTDGHEHQDIATIIEGEGMVMMDDKEIRKTVIVSK